MKEMEIEKEELYNTKYEEERANAALRKLYFNRTYAYFLASAPDDQEIRVATKAGRGWIWIDNVKFLRENIEKEEMLFQNYTETTIATAEKRLLELPFEMCDYILKLEKNEWPNQERKEMAEHTLRGKQKSFATYSNDLSMFQHHKKHWTHIKDRKIKEIYKATSDGKDICVILEGLEPGDRWYKDDKDATGRWDMD